ncbi:MAG TPA: TonB family protein [Pyrinomonadaceae bacterium]|nr:TonB family protein [Pyrinomonadaceae bacterium]
MMTPDPYAGPVRVSILERIVPSIAFMFAAISGAVGAAMLLKLLANLREAENSSYSWVFNWIAQDEFLVAGVLVFAAALCAVGILVSAIRLFTKNTKASPPGLLFLMTGLLSLVPAFALHYVLHLVKEVTLSPDATSGGISGIAGTVTAVAWFSIGSAVVISLLMLAFSFIPFSSRPGRKSSPLVCLFLAEIFMAVLIGIYFWEARESITERDKDPGAHAEPVRDTRDPSVEIPDVGSRDSDLHGDADGRAVVGREDLSIDAGSNSRIQSISGGVLNGKATTLPQPVYPAAARAVKATGAVTVQVLVDEKGAVVSATAVSGHPLLRAAAVEAARQARFAPVQQSKEPVKVSGILTYNFSGK